MPVVRFRLQMLIAGIPVCLPSLRSRSHPLVAIFQLKSQVARFQLHLLIMQFQLSPLIMSFLLRVHKE